MPENAIAENRARSTHSARRRHPLALTLEELTLRVRERMRAEGIGEAEARRRVLSEEDARRASAS